MRGLNPSTPAPVIRTARVPGMRQLRCAHAMRGGAQPQERAWLRECLAAQASLQMLTCVLAPRSSSCGQLGARMPRRFMAMMWRLNFLVAVTCVVLQNSYMLYYICPMHTLFTIMVYAALGIAPQYNQSHAGILIKCA